MRRKVKVRKEVKSELLEPNNSRVLVRARFSVGGVDIEIAVDPSTVLEALGVKGQILLAPRQANN